MDFARPQKF